MIVYKELNGHDVTEELFGNFRRHQEVTRCWRKIDGTWQIKDIAFVEEWTEKEYAILVSCLRDTIRKGGMVAGAFCEGRLKGFVSVEAALFGQNREYVELSCIHVSEDMRGEGIGKELFRIAKKRAKLEGAAKLYISAHSSVESQAFYRAAGCVEAREYSREHVEKEPCDCQLECPL